MDCQRDNTTTVGCFLAGTFSLSTSIGCFFYLFICTHIHQGDYRANEQLGLLAMHNLWIRQHNTLVDKLKRVNPHWHSEQLFQEARKIVGAQMQVITFESWLPKILGPVGMEMLGKYSKYEPNVDSTVSNEFATAAFRYTICGYF